jgi:glutamate formiminotransferase/formiminotetrahydrofolate cyclodeaminase
METAAKAYPLLGDMAEKGNPASISDVGVGLLAVRACIEGAAMNVRINLGGLKDQEFSGSLREKMQRITKESETEFKRLHAIVDGKLG